MLDTYRNSAQKYFCTRITQRKGTKSSKIDSRTIAVGLAQACLKQDAA